MEKREQAAKQKLDVIAEEVEWRDETMKSAQPCVTVLLVKNESALSRGHGTSYTLYIPQGFGLNILRRLSYSGCKAIGLEEYRHLMLESNKLVYPFDFPNSRGHKIATTESTS